MKPFKVDAIDTVAAGDCFNGAFAVALLEGNDPWAAARFANARRQYASRAKARQHQCRCAPKWMSFCEKNKPGDDDVPRCQMLGIWATRDMRHTERRGGIHAHAPEVDASRAKIEPLSSVALEGECGRGRPQTAGRETTLVLELLSLSTSRFSRKTAVTALPDVARVHGHHGLAHFASECLAELGHILNHAIGAELDRASADRSAPCSLIS